MLVIGFGKRAGHSKRARRDAPLVGLVGIGAVALVAAIVVAGLVMRHFVAGLNASGVTSLPAPALFVLRFNHFVTEKMYLLGYLLAALGLAAQPRAGALRGRGSVTPVW